jgi:hypothetical protein
MAMTPDRKPPPSAAVTAQPGSRLEELLAAYEPAKAAAEEAAARFKAVTDAIKTETTAGLPEGVQRASIAGAPGLPRLKLSWIISYRFDSKRFKEECPEMYVRYEKQAGFWELRAQG